MNNEQETDQVEVSIGDSLVAVNECLIAIHKRLEALESYVNELPTPDKTYYKPEGQDEYLNIKANYDQIYKRLKKLEDGM